jgi:hypothetical protein
MRPSWDGTEAIWHIEAAVAESPLTGGFQASRCLRPRRTSGRERSLEAALAEGYSRALARSDDDLSAIVRLPRIQELLKDAK